MKDIPAAVLERLRANGALMKDAELLGLAAFAAEVPKDQEIVEIGSWAGGSAAWLCAGSRYGKGAHITCIDIWTDWIDPPEGQWPVLGSEAYEQFVSNVDMARLTPLRGESHTVSALWTKPIGLLFIDGLHTYEGCKTDLEDWSGFVPSGARIAVHDYLEDQPSEEYWWTEGPTKAVQEVASAWTAAEIAGHSLWTALKP